LDLDAACQKSGRQEQGQGEQHGGSEDIVLPGPGAATFVTHYLFNEKLLASKGFKLLSGGPLLNANLAMCSGGAVQRASHRTALLIIPAVEDPWANLPAMCGCASVLNKGLLFGSRMTEVGGVTDAAALPRASCMQASTWRQFSK
jgi:hypothetical protein